MMQQKTYANCADLDQQGPNEAGGLAINQYISPYPAE